MSRRFIETCARPSTMKPLACTPGNPPLDVRICFAISFATAISCVSRYTLNATRNGRAPIAVAPAVGCTLLGPKSGSSARSRMASNSPLRTSGSSTRSGRVAARAYRKTGIRSSFPTRSPSVCASATHSSIVMPVTGTNGTTSVAPMRGCSPLCLVRSIRSVATRMAANAASTTAAGLPTNVNTERLCAVSLWTSSSCTPVTAVMVERNAPIVAASRPSEKFGTHSTSGAGISSSLIDR